MPKTGLIGFRQTPIAQMGGMNAQMIGALGVEQPACGACGMILGNLSDFDIQSHDATQGIGKMGILTYPVKCRSCGAKQTVTVTVAVAVKVELEVPKQLTEQQVQALKTLDGMLDSDFLEAKTEPLKLRAK